MKWHKTLLAKIILLLIVLVLPITGMYTYSYYNSLKIMENDIKERNLSKLLIVKDQLDSRFNQMSVSLLSMSKQPNVQELSNIDLLTDYYQITTKSAIIDYLSLLQNLSPWQVDFSVFSPRQNIVLATQNGSTQFEEISSYWELHIPTNKEAYFTKHLMEPSNYVEDMMEANIVLEAKFPIKNIEEYFFELEEDGYNNLLLYNANSGEILSNIDGEREVVVTERQLKDIQNSKSGHLTVMDNDQEYFVTYAELQSLDWYLIDYTLSENIFSTLTKTRNLFYVFVATLLLLSICTVFLLYKNIQSPIHKMIKAIKLFKDGNYSARIQPNQVYEFQVVVSDFNEMAQQIENLIEVVYKEELRYKEIHLKQLQFQINPHFLYNCLFIIKNMAKLKQFEAIEAMSVYLGNYYRYMTKPNDIQPTLQEELDFVKNYLDIHQIRIQQLEYQIRVSEEMKKLQIPRLLIQPIVENAIEHGIPGKTPAKVFITAEIRQGIKYITIEDNGTQIDEEKLVEIQNSILQSEGRGIWNVNQRLHLHFGARSGLKVSQSDLGGLKVVMRWR